MTPPAYWICAECGRQLTVNLSGIGTIPVRTCHLNARAYPIRDGRVEWRGMR